MHLRPRARQAEQRGEALLCHTWCMHSAVRLVRGARCGSAPCAALKRSITFLNEGGSLRSSDGTTSIASGGYTCHVHIIIYIICMHVIYHGTRIMTRI